MRADAFPTANLFKAGYRVRLDESDVLGPRPSLARDTAGDPGAIGAIGATRHAMTSSDHAVRASAAGALPMAGFRAKVTTNAVR